MEPSPRVKFCCVRGPQLGEYQCEAGRGAGQVYHVWGTERMSEL